ncbi:MAG: hypothetical protein HXX14_07315 [Bacteroidetes bacterium]|nr:hypothetical protein [Bacteroidota bacterium]
MNRYSLLFLSFFFLTLLSCHKDNKLDVLPGQEKVTQVIASEINNITSQYGRVMYNDSLKRYVINFGNKVFDLNYYTTTSCIVLPDSDLPDQYKKSGMEVLISGVISAKKTVYSNKKIVYKFPTTLAPGYTITPAPDTLNYWNTNFDYIKIKTPNEVLFFSNRANRMEGFGSYTVMNLPNIQVYGRGAGINYKQLESASVSIFDSTNRFANSLPEVLKVGYHNYAVDAKSPGVSLDWNITNSRYNSTRASDQLPGCYFKILRCELVSNSGVAKYYRIAASFKCVLTRNDGSSSYRMLCEGVLAETIQF